LDDAAIKLSESRSKLADYRSRNKNQKQSTLKSRSQPIIPAKASKTSLLHSSSSSPVQSSSAGALNEKRKQEKQPKRKIGE
jgi:hypothetical protein